jgi:hypothetical protein
MQCVAEEYLIPLGSILGKRKLKKHLLVKNEIIK